MQIEKMTAVLRPRNNWEAVDLGFFMARHWFLQLWLLWMLTALPVFVINQLFLYNHPKLAWLIIWWLKPLYELPLLYFLSRVLFGEYLQVTAIRKNYFRIVKPMVLPLLTWRRISLSRSFNNPVQMLEALRGQGRVNRLNVLNFKTNNVGQWLTVVCAHFELFLYLSLIGLIIMMVPDTVPGFDWSLLFAEGSVLFQIITSLIYFLVISLVAPFYTAAGFSLYLARRTDLEGWDIELGFRKLINRLHANVKLTPAVLVLLLACVCWLPPQPACGQTTDSAKAAAVIAEVINRADFGDMNTRHVWKPRLPSTEDLDRWSLPGFIQDFLKAIGGLFSWIGNLFSNGAGLFEAMLWISISMLLILLLLRLRIWSRWLGGPGGRQNSSRPVPTRLFGLDVKAGTIPADIFSQVQKLIAQGELRAALSLLYRASLIKLIHLHQLDIPESATEGECLQIVRNHRPEPETTFFQRMTGAWLRLAYAHESPDRDALQDLSREWQIYYGINQ